MADEHYSEEMLERYEAFKNDEISVTELSDRELILFQEMLEDECERLSDEVNRQKWKNYQLEMQVEKMKKRIRLTDAGECLDFTDSEEYPDPDDMAD